MSNEMKFTVKMDPNTGALTLDFTEWFTELSTEKKQELFPYWEDIAYEQMEDLIRNRFSAPNYNSIIHKMRMDILTSDDAPEVFREVIRTLLGEVDQAKAKAKASDKAFWNLYHSWPEQLRHERPHIMPEHTSTPMKTDVDADEYIKTHSEVGTDAKMHGCNKMRALSPE